MTQTHKRVTVVQIPTLIPILTTLLITQSAVSSRRIKMSTQRVHCQCTESCAKTFYVTMLNLSRAICHPFCCLSLLQYVSYFWLLVLHLGILYAAVLPQYFSNMIHTSILPRTSNTITFSQLRQTLDMTLKGQ